MTGHFFQGLSHMLPSQCAICHRWPGRAVCDDCISQFGQPIPRCRRCALPVAHEQTSPCSRCAQEASALDEALAAVSYAFPWAGLVQQFKFHEQTAWARTLAGLMRSAPWVEPALENADWLIALPLSAERLQERGFNQSLLLARALEPRKTQAHLLLRVRHTSAQSSLHRTERLAALQGAFAIDPQHYGAVEGKRIVLVDDVMTTGASLQSAAGVLRQAGAKHITGLVFARTE